MRYPPVALSPSVIIVLLLLLLLCRCGRSPALHHPQPSEARVRGVVASQHQQQALLSLR